jgi:hypothetical protein
MATMPECPKDVWEDPRSVTIWVPRRKESGRAAPQSEAPKRPREEGALCCLLSPVLREPVRLDEGTFYRIGRDRTNEIALPSSHVSRLHADIVPENGAWVIEDLGSTNGTFVNGERVATRRTLRDGDRISVWRFEMIYRELSAEQLAALERSSGSAGGGLRAAQDEIAFRGELRQLSVIELVEVLVQNRKTGLLTVEEGGTAPERRLWLSSGAIVHAEVGSVEGERAVHAILRCSSGNVAFRACVAPTKRTVKTPAATLLMLAKETMRF